MRTDTGDGLIPCSVEEALARMLAMEASRLGCYAWGGGHYDPMRPELLGMTRVGDLVGWDCAGAAISEAFRLFRHRPGFNAQPQATVSDDLNCDSVLEDSCPRRGGRLELGELVTIPAPGILLITPSIRLPPTETRPAFFEPGHVRMILDATRWKPGAPRPAFFEPGHVRMILDATRWKPGAPRWADVVYLECRGPSGRKPGVVRATGESVDEHDALWPHPLHRAALVRIRARP